MQKTQNKIIPVIRKTEEIRGDTHGRRLDLPYHLTSAVFFAEIYPWKEVSIAYVERFLSKKIKPLFPNSIITRSRDNECIKLILSGQYV